MLLNRRKRYRQKLKSQWGLKPAERHLDEDILQDVSRYWRAKAAQVSSDRHVDDITWNDLDMNRVFQSLNHARSIVGSEALYAMLRDVGSSEEELSKREAMICRFEEDAELRTDVQIALDRIGKAHFHDAVSYLFKPEKRYPDHGWLYYVLGILPIVCLICGLIHPAALVLIPLFLVINLVVYYRSSLIWRAELRAVRHIASVLNCARALGKIKRPGMDEDIREIRKLVASMRGVNYWCSVFAMELPGEIGILSEYPRILFLIPMISLCRIISHLIRHENEMRRLYDLVGNMDACLAIASLRASCEGLAQPEFTDERKLEAVALVHPLVREPVPNDCVFERNALITGSNASGKSTFIKAVAVNAILAQTIHTCWARFLSMCRGRVMTSMAVRDDITRGESYFVAEIRSLKRILDATKGDKMVFCFVDEILRGTNTVERIAASSSVLRSLGDRRILCMAATHDVELTRLLAGDFDNWHFSEKITEDGVVFDYLRRNGPATGRNAIALLERMGFERTVIDSANGAVRRFEESGKWAE